MMSYHFWCSDAVLYIQKLIWPYLSFLGCIMIPELEVLCLSLILKKKFISHHFFKHFISHIFFLHSAFQTLVRHLLDVFSLF